MNYKTAIDLLDTQREIAKQLKRIADSLDFVTPEAPDRDGGASYEGHPGAERSAPGLGCQLSDSVIGQGDYQ